MTEDIIDEINGPKYINSYSNGEGYRKDVEDWEKKHGKDIYLTKVDLPGWLKP